MTLTIQEDSKHNLMITLPNGRRALFMFEPKQFAATLPPHFGGITVPVYENYVLPNYEPATFGVKDKLTVQGFDFLIVQDGEYYDLNLDVFYPRFLTLTTIEGHVYQIDREQGVLSITEPNNDQITFTENGIIHSSGTGINFTRDTRGRITRIDGPEEKSVSYAYDTAGDLVTFTDPAAVNITMQYTGHALEKILGPGQESLLNGTYDSTGRLSKVTDGLNNSVQFIHDPQGRRETIFDRNGNITTYYYDEEGRVTTLVDPLGGRTTYTYDADGNKIAEVNPKGERTAWTYDSFGNILAQTDAMGNTTFYTYAEGLPQKNLPLTITDAAGNTTSYTYDSKGNLLATTDALGNTTSNTYNEQGKLTSTTDAMGNVTSYEYDPVTGYNTRIVYPNGMTMSYTYDIYGNQLTDTKTWTDENGVEHSLTYTNDYNERGQLVKRTDPGGHSTWTLYNNLGQKVKDIDIRGKETTYEYDDNGQLMQTNYPDGTFDKTEYDNNGNKKKFTDRYGQVTQYFYDALNRLTKTINHDGSCVTNSYDSAGRLLYTMDTRGYITRYEYDTLGRTVKVIDPLGNATTYAYDSLGNRTRVTDARGNTVKSIYDALNRLTKTTFADGTAQSFTYDNMGRKTSQTDQAGTTTYYRYDTNGNLAEVEDAAGNITKYEYDTQDNQTAQIDARGRRTEFKYDEYNRLIERKLPMGQTESYTYNFDGSIATHRDFMNRITTYGYTSLGRLAYKQYPDNSMTRYEYYPDGRRMAVENGSGRVFYEYDTMNRLKKVTSPAGWICYEYDSAGNRTSLTTASGTVSYTYDELNRLKTVTDMEGKVTTYSYDANGNREKMILPNQTETVYTYNNLNRLTSLTNRKTNGDLINSFQYSLNAAGMRTKVVENGGDSTVNYTYDQLYRLTREERTGSTNYVANYTYDETGNRLTKTGTDGNFTYQYDDNDRLLSDGKYTYTWDNAQNLISKSGADGLTTYSYDYENKMTAVTDSTGTVTMSYDGNGNRLSATKGGLTTQYLVDVNRRYAQVLEEIQGVNKVTYTYGDDLLKINRGGQEYYYHQDGHGSIRALTNATAVVTDSWDFEAFGNIINRTGSTPNNYLFAGEQLDSTGLYYNRARYYDPQNGRFTQSDTFPGDPQSPITLHRYLYCNADPVNFIDPSGNFSLPELSVTTLINGMLSAMPMLSMLTLRVVMWVANNQTLLANIAAFSFVANIASTVYVSLEESGIAPSGPRINGYSIAQYIQMASGITLLLTCAISSMAPNLSGPSLTRQIQERATQLRDELGEFRGTMGVGIAQRPNGSLVRLISTSEGNGYVRPNVTINANEIMVSGPAGVHAEVDIVNYCNKNNLKLLAVGATRPVCPNCVTTIGTTEANISTVLKPNKWYPVYPNKD